VTYKVWWCVDVSCACALHLSTVVFCSMCLRYLCCQCCLCCPCCLSCLCYLSVLSVLGVWRYKQRVAWILGVRTCLVSRHCTSSPAGIRRTWSSCCSPSSHHSRYGLTKNVIAAYEGSLGVVTRYYPSI
jgi:hypothetical protein